MLILNMKINCACLNNTPVRINININDEEQYECFNCKFKWRYINIYSSYCDSCNSSGVNALHKIKKNLCTYVKCNLCGIEHIDSKYSSKRMLVLW